MGAGYRTPQFRQGLFGRMIFRRGGRATPQFCKGKIPPKNTYSWPKNAKFFDHFMAKICVDFPLSGG